MEKNPALVAAGRRGAAKRWGPHGRIIRLADLTPDQRRAITAYLEVSKAAESVEPDKAA